MSRVIKRQEIKKEKEYQATCKKCRSVFAHTMIDVVRDHFHGDYVRCPACGAYNELTQEVKNDLK
jgi:rRNA maturation endonuclease Nob1